MKLVADRLPVLAERELVHFQHDPVPGRFWPQMPCSNLTADHQMDQVFHRQFVDGSAGHHAPVLQHRGAVSELEDLGQSVRDVKDPETV